MNQTSDSVESTRFDVREIPCRVKHTQIFQRWSDLPVDRHFILINDHDPIPLYYQFAAQFPGAFTWEYLVSGPEEFQVKITRLATTPKAGGLPPSLPAGGSRKVVMTATPGIQEVDARGLEPPEPLILILNTLESLPAGFSLRAVTDRKPCHLYGEAEHRGFRLESTEQPDGSWVTTLARA